MDTLNLKPYGRSPTHHAADDPYFNMLLDMEAIAFWYWEYRWTHPDDPDVAQCFLNEDVKQASAYQDFQRLLFGINEQNKLKVLIPDDLAFAFDTDMTVVEGAYGIDWGRLIITY